MTTSCPICSGTGQIEAPRHALNDLAMRKASAIALRNEGYSMRQIAKFCGWKSVRSVAMILGDKSAGGRPPKSKKPKR